MDFAALSNSLKQFLDIFDKSNVSNDAVLKTPQENQPSKELVAEFEQYMQETPETAQTDGISQLQPNSPFEVHFTDNAVIETPKIEKPAETQNISAEPQEYLNEIQEIFSQIENNELTASNLFRLQYLTNMLNVQVTQNNSLSKSSTEQFETFLKQQG